MSCLPPPPIPPTAFLTDLFFPTPSPTATTTALDYTHHLPVNVNVRVHMSPSLPSPDPDPAPSATKPSSPTHSDPDYKPFLPPIDLQHRRQSLPNISSDHLHRQLSPIQSQYWPPYSNAADDLYPTSLANSVSWHHGSQRVDSAGLISSKSSSVDSPINMSATFPPPSHSTSFQQYGLPPPTSPPALVPALQTPPSSGSTRTPAPTRRRGKLPKSTTDHLKQWLHNHSDHPYPSEEEKKQLCAATQLSMSQVSNWMINARRRILAPARRAQERQALNSAPSATRTLHHSHTTNPVPSSLIGSSLVPNQSGLSHSETPNRFVTGNFSSYHGGIGNDMLSRSLTLGSHSGNTHQPGSMAMTYSHSSLPQARELIPHASRSTSSFPGPYSSLPSQTSLPGLSSHQISAPVSRPNYSITNLSSPLSYSLSSHSAPPPSQLPTLYPSPNSPHSPYANRPPSPGGYYPSTAHSRYLGFHSSQSPSSTSPVQPQIPSADVFTGESNSEAVVAPTGSPRQLERKHEDGSSTFPG